MSPRKFCGPPGRAKAVEVADNEAPLPPPAAFANRNGVGAKKFGLETY
jgi:hypothetical protein